MIRKSVTKQKQEKIKDTEEYFWTIGQEQTKPWLNKRGTTIKQTEKNHSLLTQGSKIRVRLTAPDVFAHEITVLLKKKYLNKTINKFKTAFSCL